VQKLTGQDKLLLDRVTAALRETDQFDQVFDAADTEGIKKLRTIGRRAGRELGWKIRTLAHTLNSGHVRVYVVVEESTPLRDELMGIRHRKAARDAINKIHFGDNNLGTAD
jgi:hypothetical protein